MLGRKDLSHTFNCMTDNKGGKSILSCLSRLSLPHAPVCLHHYTSSTFSTSISPLILLYPPLPSFNSVHTSLSSTYSVTSWVSQRLRYLQSQIYLLITDY